MSLGEAFVEVRADLRPFARDLQRSLPPIVKAFERELNRATTRAMSEHGEEEGRKAGDKLGRGVRRGLNDQFKKKNFFISLASSLGGALDDGISALPTEVKAAIVLGLIAALPIIAGGLTGAVVAGIGGGLAALGILLASQFDVVQTKGVETGRFLRDELVNAARSFVPVILEALALVQTRLAMLSDAFDSIFNDASKFVEPLTVGTLNGFEEIIRAIENTTDKFQPFVEELASGFQVIGEAIGNAIEILVSTGDDGVTALRDLIAIVAGLIVAAAQLLKVLTSLYALIRKVAIVIGELTGPFSIVAGLILKIIRLIDEHSNKNKSYINTNTDLNNSLDGTVVATKKATQALEEYQKALQGAAEAAQSNLELNLRWEESLDRISESLDKNGNSLDIHTEKGRANINEFLNGLKIAEERALLRVQRGEATAEQAASQYQAEIQQLRELGRQAGISDQDFENLFRDIIDTSALRISAQDMGVQDLNGALDQSVSAAQRLRNELELISHLRMTIGAGALAGVKGFADGGIHALPSVVSVAEDGPEVTIPLTKPARAATLLRQSGLANMFSAAPSQILVYVGNEQLDARMVRIVQRSNSNQALALTQGPRRF